MNETHWNERYAASERLFSADPDGTLVELAGGLPPGRALDLGAGEGRNSLWLASLGWRVTAVDLSDVALTRLAASAVEHDLNVTTEVADMNEFLGRAGRFDLVVLANIHPAPEERAELLAGAAAALAPGGHLFIVGHHVDSLGKAGPPRPERLYTEDIVARAFPDLELLRLEKREGRHGDRDEPVTDVVAWASRPNDATVSS
jgi:SAM-dependent methyltransferase